jgi:hypothetical protein
MTHESLQRYLEQHPRMIGALAAALLALTQAGSAFAGGCAALAIHGP